MGTKNETPADERNGTAASRSVERLVHPCHDCGKPTHGPLLMNRHVAGDFQYLCAECLEENDPEDVMVEPCPRCGGNGIEWEGWNCEYCDGSGEAY